jgi:geranylgeranyl diphosphate synthase type II
MPADCAAARAHLKESAALVEGELKRWLASRGDVPKRLREAMEHSLLAGGKRLRPALVLAACDLVGGEREAALPGALALEMIHTYSLIHDDLPAMDDDDLRRGKPTCHVAFGEATAILAGDALLTEAFAVLAGSKAEPKRVRRAIAELATAAGAAGMVGGQQLDLEGEGGKATAAAVEGIHEKKTAALIRASVLLGGVLGGGQDEEISSLGRYGHALGLAFQAADDVLDATSTAEELGKSPGKDAEQGKLTLVAAVGLEKARARARELADEAVKALSDLSDGSDRSDLSDKRRHAAQVLRELAVLAVERRS